MEKHTVYKGQEVNVTFLLQMIQCFQELFYLNSSI